MSAMCTAERYNADKVTLRISASPDQAMIRDCAYMLASECESILGVDGSNILYGDGRWKGETENGATIEIVARDVSNRHMLLISEYVNFQLGLTCFATVEPVTAYELYELAE